MSNVNRNTCPKCGVKLKPTYMKQNCPKCGVNLLYYKMDERLAADVEKAKRETDAVKKFLFILKNSSVVSPLLIIRLILFFTPLASMCLPMYWAGHKKVSLISLIMGIINRGFDIGAMLDDISFFFAFLSMILVIVLSLAVIISSLFSCTKNGFKRNIVFSLVNTLGLAVTGGLVCIFGGELEAGYYVTFAIYGAEIILHFLCAKTKTNKRKKADSIVFVLAVIMLAASIVMPTSEKVISYNPIIPIEHSTVNIVTFNTAGPWGTSFDDTDPDDRCTRFAEYMRHVNPDSIGTQEINSLWIESLEELLPNYEAYGVKRGGDSEENNSEMNAVIWNADKYDAIETDTFWLTETPEKEGKYTYIDENGEQQEAGCNRICSYAVLENKETKQRYIHMNTHLDNAAPQARDFGAELIVNKAEDLKKKYGDHINIVLTGDFNTSYEDENEKAYDIITSVFKDTTDRAKTKATFQNFGYTRNGDKPIDFIFYLNGSSSNYQILDSIPHGYVSDHFGVYAELSF